MAHRAIGNRCDGNRLRGGWKCTHGAPALGEPEASGFTLRKRRNNVQARVR